MLARVLAVAAAAFATGLLVGRFASAPQSFPPALDLTQDVGVIRLETPHEARCLRPYRLVVGGNAKNLSPAAPGGEHWRIDLLDNRVTVFAATVP